MNVKIDTALQDINIIKSALEDTKVHYRGMYLMCFLMAAVKGTGYICILLEMRFMPSMLIGHFVGIYICPLVLMAGYLYIYRNEKKYSNKYYLSMIGIWGFMASVVPSVAVLVDIIGLILGRSRTYDSAGGIHGSDNITAIANIVLFSIFLIICAYVLNQRIFMAVTVLNLFCYMLLDQCFALEGIPFQVGNQMQTKLAYSSVYSILVTTIGYIALGLYLRNKQNRQVSGG